MRASRLGGMPKLTTLLATFVLGLGLFVLFAFTFVGLVGEAIILVSVIGVIAHVVSTGYRRCRHR